MNKVNLFRVVMVFLTIFLVGCINSSSMSIQPSIPSQNFQVLQSNEGFKRAIPGVKLEFPKDHAAHPEYQTEWWYFTGNLTSDQGKEFGYQLTFFRRAVSAAGNFEPGTSNWSTNQVYMGHFALVDVSAGSFSAWERFERGGANLAGTQSEPQFSVWLQDWKVDQLDQNRFSLIAQEQGQKIQLLLQDLKGPVLQGNMGYSQKGPEEGNASYYYSLPRLQSTGSIKIGQNLHQVKGYSWMDHEYGTSALGVDQVGWDWFALHLSDGSELMVYTIRNKLGKIDEFSRGVYIDSSGKVDHLKSGDFQIIVEGQWKSQKSGGTYPARWSIKIQRKNLDLIVIPKIPDQELGLSIVYWEGSVKISGKMDNQNLTGSGYVELTGYAGSMQGRF